MRQIPADELRFVLKFELQQLPKSIRNDLSSGHAEARYRALDYAVAALTKRMEKWEILVPDVAENIFRDVILAGSGPPNP